MDKEALQKYNRLVVEKYDVSRFKKESPVDCVMPGYFSGNEVLFVAQNPGQLKTDDDDMFYDAYADKDFDKMEVLYAKALKSKRGAYGIFINDIYGSDWSRISFTNVFKCPFVANVIPDEVPERELKILTKQIELVKPRVIVAVGSVARDALMRCHSRIQELVLSMKHPSYLKRIGRYDEIITQYRIELSHAITKSLQR